MENIFEIGRTIEAQMRDGLIEHYWASDELFAFSLDLAQRFEYEYPDTDDYYGDLDKFVIERLQQKFGKEK
jgi:hypothetical protein